jgi:hypothetical protein
MAKKTRSLVARKPGEQLMPEQEFFMKIDEPLNFRRAVLETSKSTLSTLKGIFAVKEIRQRKLSKLSQLQKEVREIRQLIQKADELMPKYSKHQAVKRFTYMVQTRKAEAKKEETKKKETQNTIEPVQRTKSELERLSDKIRLIEGRIQKLPPVPEKKQETAPVVGKQPAQKKESKPNEDLGMELGKALDKIHKKLKEI